jgi:hypothetical protein
VQIKTPKDKQEKELRLHKERLNFYVKDLGTWLLVIAIAFYSLWVLVVPIDSPQPDKERARSVLMLIVGGAVGFVFGKHVAK